MFKNFPLEVNKCEIIIRTPTINIKCNIPINICSCTDQNVSKENFINEIENYNDKRTSP
jgi:hypothetical protein